MPTADIFADRYWNETGIHLVAECRYKFSVVSGVGATLKDASFTARSIAGEDWTSLPRKTAELFNGKRMDNARWFAPIGTVGKEHPGLMAGVFICYRRVDSGDAGRLLANLLL